MTETTRRHVRWGVFDSSRFDEIPLRPGDIIASMPPKCGNHWIATICAMLIHGGPNFSHPLPVLCPTVDMVTDPIEEIRARLEVQSHRRLVRAHMPLDSLPAAAGVTMVVGGRDPRDVAVSHNHFMATLDAGFLSRANLTLEAGDLRSSVLRFLFDDGDPAETGLYNLRATVDHLAGAWARRDDPDVILVHYTDLSRDLEGEIRKIATRLGIELAPQAWPAVVDAARFDRMKANAGTLLHDNILDKKGFFHSGTSGQWNEILTEDDVARYEHLLSQLAPADLVEWLHYGGTR